MTTNLKADARARMRQTGEKYTEARRGILLEREAAQPSATTARVTTTQPTMASRWPTSFARR